MVNISYSCYGLLYPIGSMYAIYGNMDPINIHPMLALIYKRTSRIRHGYVYIILYPSCGSQLRKFDNIYHIYIPYIYIYHIYIPYIYIPYIYIPYIYTI